MASRNGPRSSTFRGREKKILLITWWQSVMSSCFLILFECASIPATPVFFNRSSWLSQTPPIIPPDAVLHCDRANQWWHRFPAWWLLSPQSVRKRLGETNCSMCQIKLLCMKTHLSCLLASRLRSPELETRIEVSVWTHWIAEPIRFASEPRCFPYCPAFTFSISSSGCVRYPSAWDHGQVPW